jgi:hypothetical protein
MTDLKLVSQRVNELSDLLNEMVTEKTTTDTEVVVASQVLDDALHEFHSKISKK